MVTESSSPDTASARPLPPLVDPSPEPAARIIRDVQRAVGPLGEAYRAVLGLESVGERLVTASRHAVRERHEHDAVPRLRQRRAVPRAVERDERAAPVARRELVTRIEDEAVRRPVAGECEQRRLLVSAAPDLLAVAAVLGCQHQVAELRIVEAVGPAEVVLLLDLYHLLRGLLGALLEREQLGPVLPQLIAPVLHGVQHAGRGIEREGDGIADTGHVADPVGLLLPRPRCVEAPHAGTRGQLLTRVLAGRFELTVGELAAVGAGAD